MKVSITGSGAADGAAGSSQRYAPLNGLGPVGSLGPAGVAGQAGLSRTSAATLGAVVSAGGLGVPIMSGRSAFNNAVIAHGSVPAILLALIVDQAL